jgi:hypothetical protein
MSVTNTNKQTIVCIKKTNIALDNDIFLNFSDEQKFVYLLNRASVRHVRVIGFYLKRSLELR